jgi:hypothetical protein
VTTIEPRTADVPQADAPTGLGGWLLLPMLGLIRTTFTHLRAVVFPAWPDKTPFAPLPEGSFVYEQWVVGFFGAAAVALLVLMFRKSRWFPIGFIAYSAASAVSQLTLFGFAAGAGYIPIGMNSLTVRPLVGAVLPAAIWIPYMLKSRRVANTFVR